MSFRETVRLTFARGFGSYVTPGDSISTETDDEGYFYVATIESDEGAGPPDEQSEGFWPSLDPMSAGYIGAMSPSTLRRHMAKAKSILESWENNEWFYCGIVVSKHRIEPEDVEPSTIDRHGASAWGIEANYPGTKNEYLNDVANDLLLETSK